MCVGDKEDREEISPSLMRIHACARGRMALWVEEGERKKMGGGVKNSPLLLTRAHMREIASHVR